GYQKDGKTRIQPRGKENSTWGQTTDEVVVTLKTARPEYEVDEVVLVLITYRNVGKATYSFMESHTGGFHSPFTVTDDKGRVLPNPYAEPPEAGASHGTFSKNALKPGKEVVIKRALNQCVHIDKPGTYTITAEFGVHRGTEGWG